MSTLAIAYTPGYTFTLGELITADKLNLAARPTINLSGTVGSALVGDGSITTAKLADGVLSADATGRGKMADGYFDASATSRGKFSANFFGAGDATSLAFFADGFWTANAAGRAKFEAGFFDSTLVNATVVPVIGSTRNLLALNNAGTPNSQVTVTADEVVLKDASAKPYLASAVNVTANIAATGANGLDTGAEAANTWYYVWLIYNGSAVASLLSVSATAPTLPGGYTFKALVGVVRNDNSSNFLTFLQQDREVFTVDTAVFTSKTGVTSWTALTSTDLTAFQGLVPPIAKQAWGSAGEVGNNGGMAIGADANGLGAVVASKGQNSAGALLSYNIGGSWRAPIKTTQTLYYIMGDTTNGYRMSVSGYKI